MLIVLSQEEERDGELGYQISNIEPNMMKKKDLDFQFDESENETFNKLKNLSAMDQ
jgi:hypothetical protein